MSSPTELGQAPGLHFCLSRSETFAMRGPQHTGAEGCSETEQHSCPSASATDLPSCTDEAFCIDCDRLVSPVPPGIDLSCPLCLDIPLRPVQLRCEHLFCRPCLVKALLSSHGQPVCPTCKAPATLTDIASVPRMVQNLVGALQVRGNADVSLRSRLTTHLTMPRCRFGVRAVPRRSPSSTLRSMNGSSASSATPRPPGPRRRPRQHE